MVKKYVPVRYDMDILSQLQRIEGANRSQKINQLLREALERRKRIALAGFISYVLVYASLLIFMYQTALG
jgi:hypothetical protein